MTARERLHQIVERLPEEEIHRAIRVLEAIEETAHDALSYTLENAPFDDEPFDAADLEGDDDEPSIPHDEVVAARSGSGLTVVP